MMPPIAPLFTLAIEPNGTVICTQPLPNLYLLTFQSPPDNRMTPAFCKTFLLALDIIDHKFPNGVVVTTSSINKFYSNGLDYDSAVKTKGFFEDSLYPLWRRLLTYPMPTLALINGHAFAAGLMTAMMHDYRIMNPHRGYICLNELDFGAPLKPPMASIFRQKLPRPDTYRTMVLESKRFNALEALKEGIVDGLGGWEETRGFVDELKLVKRGQSGVYGILKAEMWRETVRLLEAGEEKESEESAIRRVANLRRHEEEKVHVEQWESPDTFTVIINQSLPPDSTSAVHTQNDNQQKSNRAIATATARLFKGISSTTFTPANSPFTRSMPAVPLAPNIQQWELKLMAVDPALQRQGLADILLTHVTAEIKRRAAILEAERKRNGGEGEAEVRMILTTIKEIKFAYYEKRGFHWTGERKVKKGILGSRNGFTVVEMEKIL
ncbi:MAG: hypothetical protein Q9187_008160 [Circinaria calcarea]